MYRKFVALLLVCVMMLAFVGCRKDAQINAVLADFDSFTAELVKKVEQQPTAAGVDEAQKFLDLKKADLTAKWDSIKGVRDFQVSEETKKKMADSITKNYSAIGGLQLKYMAKSMSDTAFKTKLDKLVKDYQGLYSV